MINQIGLRSTLIKWMFRDWLRKAPIRWMSYANLGKYVLSGKRDLGSLFSAHRYHPSRVASDVVAGDWPDIAPRLDAYIERVNLPSVERVARRSIVVKNPQIHSGVIEKGVLIITFTETFPYYLRNIACDELLKYFHVVLEPSWAGYCDPNILAWTNFAPTPVFVEATERTDYEFLERLNTNLVPVSFGASDWVDFRIFKPLPGVAKVYDSIYVTNYHHIKRHHVFLKAIRDLKDPSYKAAMAFGINGEDREDIERLIEFYGVRSNLTIFEALPPHELNMLLNKSKVNVLFSLKEGSNRSIFEAMFAGVPGVVLDNNVGVNKSYINPSTGRLIPESEVVNVLISFRTEWGKFHPAEWALNNISPLVTTGKLNKTIGDIASKRGELWSSPCVAKVNAPEVEYFYTEDRACMLSSMDVLKAFTRGKLHEETHRNFMSKIIHPRQ